MIDRVDIRLRPRWIELYLPALCGWSAVGFVIAGWALASTSPTATGRAVGFAIVVTAFVPVCLTVSLVLAFFGAAQHREARTPGALFANFAPTLLAILLVLVGFQLL